MSSNDSHLGSELVPEGTDQAEPEFTIDHRDHDPARVVPMFVPPPVDPKELSADDDPSLHDTAVDGAPRPVATRRRRWKAVALAACALVMLVACITTLSVRADRSARRSEAVTLLAERPAQLHPNVPSIRVGAYILSVSNVIAATGMYTVDMYVSMRCSDGACESFKWEFMNGRARSIELNVDEPDYREYRIQADLQSPPDLRRYPFDALPIRVTFEDATRSITAVQFIADQTMSSVDPTVYLAGWSLKDWDARIVEHLYPQWDERYSRFVFEMRLGRSPLSALLKSIAPGIVIVTSGLLALILGPKHALQRIGVGTSSLIAAIMFHINITSQLPPIGYLTFADKFMLINYVALVSTLFISITLYAKLQQGDDDLELPGDIVKVHRMSRASIPALWAAAIAMLFLLGL